MVDIQFSKTFYGTSKYFTQVFETNTATNELVSDMPANSSIMDPNMNVKRDMTVTQEKTDTMNEAEAEDPLAVEEQVIKYFYYIFHRKGTFCFAE